MSPAESPWVPLHRGPKEVGRQRADRVGTQECSRHGKRMQTCGQVGQEALPHPEREQKEPKVGIRGAGFKSHCYFLTVTKEKVLCSLGFSSLFIKRR